tara:strand:+ start:2277 stop:3080 length:804 start_codon:yes stop_codon:yes gene_type:complete
MSEEKIKFVILAPQRTGSNLLVSYLDHINAIRCRYDIMCYKSLESNQDFIKEFGITNFIESCYHHNFDGNMKFKEEIENPNLANGFKLSYKDLMNYYFYDNGVLKSSLKPEDEIEEILDYFKQNNYKIILLDRKSKIEQYYSFKTAENTNKWMITDEKDLPERDESITVDMNNFDYYITNNVNWEKYAKDRLSEFDTFNLLYEEFVEDIEGTVAEICEFLGVRFNLNREHLANKIPIKQRRTSIVNLIENYNEVRQYLRRHKLNEWI